MSSIDQRIVQMRFDNAGFQNGISSTLKSLTQLNESLKMKDASKGLENVDSKMQNLGSKGVSGMMSGLSTLTSKFSALEIAGITAFVNITNSAVNAGKNLVKSLTLEPVMDGFKEYELKMNSIQTILTNTAQHGTTLKDVNSALNELNDYSDKTIYNFAQMTDNIGKATAAGLELDDAVIFVKGMSNAAAGFGVDATRMAGATYQMTQALSAGVVKLQDWRSMEQAGMGGKKIQDEMYAAADGLGIFVDKSIPFRDSLEQGWLTSEVFTKAMESMANDKSLTDAAQNVTSFTKLLDTMREQVGSGWAQTFEHIFGDKDQSTALFTSISNGFNDIIGPSTEARNSMLEFWNEAGGRNDVIEGLSNILQSVGKALGSVGKAFSNVFPPTTGQQLVEMSKGFLELTKNFKLSDSAARNIQNVFEGLFSIVDFGINVVTSLFKALTPIGSVVMDLAGRFLETAGNVGEFITNINDAANKSGIFTAVSDGITKAFEFISNAIQNVINKLGDFWNAIGDINFDPILDFMSTMASGIGDGVLKVFDGIGKAIGKIDFGTIIGFMAAIAAGKGLGVFKTIADTVTGFFDDISSVGDSVAGILDGVKGSLVAYQRDIQANTLIKLAIAIGILSASLVALSTINSSELEVALTGITFLFAELIGGLSLLMKVMAGANLKGFFSMATAMVAMSGAILLLSFAVKKLSDLSWSELAVGLTGTIALLGSLIATTKLMNKGVKGMISTATGLVIFAGAINIMANAVKSLSTLNPESLTKGLVGVGVLLAELAVFMKVTNMSRMSIRSATGILILSAALNVLAGAVRSIATVGSDRLGSSLTAIGLLLAELALFTKLTSGTKGVITTSVGLILLSTAMNIMAGAIRSIAAVPMKELGKSLMGIAGSLVIFGTAAALIPGWALIKTATGVTIMAGAMNLLDGALQNLGKMSMKEIGKSLIVLAGALGIFAGAMALMTTGLPGAAAMMVMSGALMLLTPQLMLLSQLSLEQLGVGLLALAGSFTILGLAGLLLGPLTPVLAALAGVIGLLSISAGIAGIGIGLFSAGLATLAAVGGAGISVITSLITNLINTLPLLGVKMGEMIINTITTLASGVPQLITAVGDLISGILTAFTDALPKVGEAALKLITTLAEFITKSFPTLVDTGVNLLLALLEGIAKNIVKVIDMASKIIINFVDGIAANLGAIIESGINLAIKFINGVANGIRNNKDAATDAMLNLIDACISAIAGAIFKFFEKGLEIIEKLISGIVSCVGKLVKTGGNIVKDVVQGISGSIKEMTSVGKNMIDGLIGGIKSMASKAVNAAKGVVKSAVDGAKNLLGIKSPSRVFKQIGSWTVEGFAIGLEKNTRMVKKPTSGIVDSVIDNMIKPINAISSLIDSDIDIDPVIKPVMDLSMIHKGSRLINDIVGGEIALSNGITSKITKSMNSIKNGNDNSDIVSAISKLRKDINNIKGTTNIIEGITYDDGSNINNTINDLVRLARIERRK